MRGDPKAAPLFAHIFGQALPIMESKAALASSWVAYLPNVLYLTFWVVGSFVMTVH